jgi:hypothetical protein
MMAKKRITRQEKIPIRLSGADRDLILEQTYIDTDHIELLKTAKLENDVITIYLTLDDLDDILGYIAFAANHADDSKLEAKLDKVYDRLDYIESMYEMIDD